MNNIDCRNWPLFFRRISLQRSGVANDVQGHPDGAHANGTHTHGTWLSGRNEDPEKFFGTTDKYGMGQYLLIPFLVGWISIYQLFWRVKRLKIHLIYMAVRQNLVPL